MLVGSRYPPTLPRPNMTLLDIHLPLCDATNEKTTLEEAFILSSLEIQLADVLDQQGYDVKESKDKADRTYKESLMKMFAVLIHFVVTRLIVIAVEYLICIDLHRRDGIR